jgi:hypothetical protein
MLKNYCDSLIISNFIKRRERLDKIRWNRSIYSKDNKIGCNFVILIITNLYTKNLFLEYFLYFIEIFKKILELIRKKLARDIVVVKAN